MGPRFRGDDEPGSRRITVRLLFALLLVSGLVACGFHLRGQADYAFKSIFITVPSSPPFEAELRRYLEGAGSAKLVDKAADAQVVLTIPSIVDEKDVLSLSSGGSVQEYQLLKRVSFRLTDVEGQDWLPPGEIVLRRTYTFNPSEVLARDTEQTRLLRDMQTDAVAQLVRRLQAARKPA